MYLEHLRRRMNMNSFSVNLKTILTEEVFDWYIDTDHLHIYLHQIWNTLQLRCVFHVYRRSDSFVFMVKIDLNSDILEGHIWLIFDRNEMWHEGLVVYLGNEWQKKKWKAIYETRVGMFLFYFIYCAAEGSKISHVNNEITRKVWLDRKGTSWRREMQRTPRLVRHTIKWKGEGISESISRSHELSHESNQV